MASINDRLQTRLREYQRLMNQPAWKGILIHGISFMIVIGAANLLIALKSPDGITALYALKTLLYGLVVGIIWALLWRWYVQSQYRRLTDKLNTPDHE